MKHFNLLLLLMSALSVSSLYPAAAASLEDAVANEVEIYITMDDKKVSKKFTKALLSNSNLLGPIEEDSGIDISSLFKEYSHLFKEHYPTKETGTLLLEDIHGLLTALSAREPFSQTLAAKSLPELFLLFLLADKLQVDLTAVSTIADAIVKKQ